MSRNPVSAAIELVDLAPSNEFRSTLRAQLLAEFTEPATTDGDESPRPNEMPPESDEEYITLAASPSSFGPKRRLLRTVLAAAACVAVFATGAAIVVKAGHRPKATSELHDADRQLAEHGLIATDDLGMTWTSGDPWGESGLATAAAATIAALPDCARLTSIGLLPPTTKSATAHQYGPGDLLFQEVLVFATPADASHAMDVIDGDVFPKCWFNLFDRLTPLAHLAPASTTEAWDVPKVYGPLQPFVIEPHGDRQIVIGQHTTITRVGSSLERYLINAFVQVGRTISWVNPRYIPLNDTTDNDPSGEAVGVNEALTAATKALTRAVGP